jgi:uncharacterized protein DUF4349
MPEPRFENVLQELRSAAPTAPDTLRDRVRALPERPVRAFRLRPALALAAGLAIAVALGAAVIGGLTGSDSSRSLSTQKRQAAQLRASPQGNARSLAPMRKGVQYCANPPCAVAGSALAERASKQAAPRFSRPGFTAPFSSDTGARTPINPGNRLQDYQASIRLRVEDLSASTKSAVRTTRRLGGYVASANYTTEGNSWLELRVPVRRAPRAITALTELGTILMQRIQTQDLQADFDIVNQQIAARRKTIELLQAKPSLTDSERLRLEAATRELRSLSRTRGALARQGSYAKIQLQLTTQKPAAKHVAPSRFDRFWSDASGILGKEAIIVLYALVVAGPFVLLAALALLGERARRRRAESRLLGETG